MGGMEMDRPGLEVQVQDEVPAATGTSAPSGPAAAQDLPSPTNPATVRGHVRQAPPPIYEPAPTGRSKKRKAPKSPEPTIVLAQEVQRDSERLRLRSWHPVVLSTEEKAAKITLGDDQLHASSTGGYKMIRATHGAHSGTWYFEIKVGALGQTGACRLGWATRQTELQGPVGVDDQSFAYRSQEGSKVHKALREPYGKPYGEGDVVGCILHIPPGGRRMEQTQEDVVKFKNKYYYIKQDDDRPAQAIPGSFVAFTLNGEFQGKAYCDILEGTYYPAVSLYTHAHSPDTAAVTVNFGDKPFAFPPPQDVWGLGVGNPWMVSQLPAYIPPQGAVPQQQQQQQQQQ